MAAEIGVMGKALAVCRSYGSALSSSNSGPDCGIAQLPQDAWPKRHRRDRDQQSFAPPEACGRARAPKDSYGALPFRASARRLHPVHTASAVAKLEFARYRTRALAAARAPLRRVRELHRNFAHRSCRAVLCRARRELRCVDRYGRAAARSLWPDSVE